MPRHNGGQSIGGGTGRKHHKQKRGITTKSRYPERLAARGLTSRSVHMPSVETLRYRQRWMLPFVNSGIVNGRLYGPFNNPVPAGRPASSVTEDEE